MSEYSSKLRLCNGTSLAAPNGKILPFGFLQTRLRLHLDAKLRAHILERDSNRFDDRLAGLGLAVLNDFVPRFFRALDVETMLTCETVVAATVLRGEQLRVFLPGARKLSAGQRLNVDISFAICEALRLV
jgi:hypothetical protein